MAKKYTIGYILKKGSCIGNVYCKTLEQYSTIWKVTGKRDNITGEYITKSLTFECVKMNIDNNTTKYRNIDLIRYENIDFSKLRYDGII